ncbi:efflux RND transporter periplasmic adaptor subunit [Pedobacter sp.]
MKRNYTGSNVLGYHSSVSRNRNVLHLIRQKVLLLSIAFLIVSCQSKPKKDHHDIGKIKIDDSLRALIAPSNEQAIGQVQAVTATYESKIFTVEAQGMINYDTRSKVNVASRVAGRLERLYVKYNYQPIKKGQLLFEIYAPDLAAAQQELIYLSQNTSDTQLIAKAKQRLLLLGLTQQTVEQIIRSKKVNYRIPIYSPADGYILEQQVANVPQSNEVTTSNSGDGGMSGMGASSAETTSASTTTQVQNTALLLREGQYVSAGQSLFTIYKADQLVAEFTLKPDVSRAIKKGTKLAFYKTANKEATFQTAAIGLIEPVVKSGENFALARVYIEKSAWRVGDVLTAKIPVLVSQSYWLPASAVVNVGAESMVFRKENGVFVAVPINTGVKVAGLVQIQQSIDGWQVAKEAAYLVDSESFISTKTKQ